MFATFFDTKRVNLDLTSTVPNLVHPTRHYEDTGDLVQELVNARVWGGIHYREAVEAGVDLGHDVARWSLKRYFRPEK